MNQKEDCVHFAEGCAIQITVVNKGDNLVCNLKGILRREINLEIIQKMPYYTES